MAFDWLAAVLPANQMPGLKIIQHGNFLVAQATVAYDPVTHVSRVWHGVFDIQPWAWFIIDACAVININMP